MAAKLKVGVVGVGAIGTVHCDAYQANSEQAELRALCDSDRQRLAAQGEKRGVAHRFSDYRDLLKSDVEAVSVCVGNTLHREVAVAALKAGKHVLLEKPMAMNAAEAAEIVAAAKKARKTLQIGMVWRQAGEAQVVRKLVEDGVLGEIYHLRAVLTRRRGIPGLGGWFTTKAQSGGGPLIDVGVHWFDIAMHLSGLWKPTHVSAMCYAKFGPRMREYRYVGMWAGPPKYDGVFDVEDYAAGFVRFGPKASMSFEISWAGNIQEQGFVELLGDKGGVRVLEGKPTTILTEFQGHVADVTPQYPDPGNRFHLQARKFLAACRGEGAPAATGEEGLIVMKLIDAVYASAAAGREVAVG
jgi:predicted dehydrogenase